MIACSEGGTSIEDLAAKYPDKIIKMPVDIKKGITDVQAQQLAKGLGVKQHLDENAKQLQALFTMMVKSDCTMVEVNPLAEGSDGRLIAADAKLNFDDNASFRQAEIFAMKDNTQADPREVQAAKFDLNYIGLDGNIGCMVNGAGTNWNGWEAHGYRL